MNEDNRKRLQGYEQEGLYSLCGLLTLASQMKPLERRLKSIPDGMRTWGLLKWAGKHLLEEVFRTTPPEQLLQIRRNLDTLGVEVGVKRSIRKPLDTFGRWVSVGTIDQLLPLFQEHCMMCNRDFDEQCKCNLRKAYGEFPVDLPEHARGCPYFTLWADV